MRSRGIAFKDHLVRAILRNDKTQTRRPIAHQPIAHVGWIQQLAPGAFVRCAPDVESEEFRCPYGVPGDRLWVRERLEKSVGGKVIRSADQSYASRVTLAPPPADRIALADWAWKPRVLAAMYCPRWASRIDLEITAIRAQRVQEITEEDARAEGVIGPKEVTMYDGIARDAFRDTWDTIHGDGAWVRNDWVWALTFKRVMP